MARIVNLCGIYPATTTPFTPAGPVDYGKFKENLSAWNKLDFAGYVVMGSTGEAPSLTNDERLKLLRVARKVAKPGSKIIAGLGLQTTAQTIEICNLVAAEKTADAALVVSPSFFKGQMTDQALHSFYTDVADKSKLPIILYSVPIFTQLDLSVSLIATLAKHPNIIGIKDSAGDITKLSDIVHQTRDEDFQVMTGNDGCLLSAFLMGCVGSISAMPCVLGADVCELYRLFKKGDMEKAVPLQRDIVQSLWVLAKYGVPGMKAAMDMKPGFNGGPSRPPLPTVDEEGRKAILQHFEKCGFPLQKQS